jgi:hypothetical protein
VSSVPFCFGKVCRLRLAPVAISSWSAKSVCLDLLSPSLDLDGVSYVGIYSATRNKLKMKIPYRTVQVSWRRLSPKTLLVISTSFIQPNAPDAADRHCAVFAAETGQKDAAGQLAESAAKSKSEYRDQITFLVPVQPARPSP